MHYYLISFAHGIGGYGSMNISLKNGPWNERTASEMHALLRKQGVTNPVLLSVTEVAPASEAETVPGKITVIDDALARLGSWIASDDTGLSSKTIVAFMTGADMKATHRIAAPRDPSDLGRCLRLLELFPEWKPRMPEMASVSEAWANVMPHWDEAAQMLEDEVGIHGEKAAEAPETYEFMKSVGF